MYFRNTSIKLPYSKIFDLLLYVLKSLLNFEIMKKVKKCYNFAYDYKASLLCDITDIFNSLM